MEFKRINLANERRHRGNLDELPEDVQSLYRGSPLSSRIVYECMRRAGLWECVITDLNVQNDESKYDVRDRVVVGPDFMTLRDCKEWAEKQHKARMEFGSIGDSISETPEKPDPVLSARYSIQYRFREDRTDCDSPWEKDWHNELCGSDFECPAEAVDFCNNSGLVISDEGVRMKTDVQYRVVKRTEEVFFDPTSTEHKQ